MGFVWNNTTVDIPMITDLFNNSTGPADVARILTYAWVYVFGGWFFAAVIGALAAALYIKYNNSMVPVAFLLIMVILFGGVLSAVPLGMPSAEIFTYIVIVLAAFSVGFMLFKIFVGKR